MQLNLKEMSASGNPICTALGGNGMFASPMFKYTPMPPFFYMPIHASIRLAKPAAFSRTAERPAYTGTHKVSYAVWSLNEDHKS